VPFFALFSAGVFVLTLGSTPLRDLLYLLPKFAVIHEHVPSRILVVFNIGPAMLAGAAVSAIEQRREKAATIGLAILVVLAGSGLAILAIGRGTLGLDGRVRTGVVAVVAVLAVAALDSASRPLPRIRFLALHRVAAVALVAALAWGLLSPSARLLRAQGLSVPPIPATPRAYADQTDAGGAGAFLRAQAAAEPFRYFGYDPTYLKDSGNKVNYHAFEEDLRTEGLLVNNRALILDLHDVQGYNPVHSQRYVEYMDALNGRAQEYHETNVHPSGLGSPLLPLLNARYVIIPRDPATADRADMRMLSARGHEVYANDAVRVLELPNALPRAWVVHDARQMAKAEILPALASGTIDPRATALVERAPPQTARPPANTHEPVAWHTYEPDYLGAEVTAAADCLVVFSETYDPGWKAFVDGQPAEIYQANYLFRAVPVSAGTHRIEMRYAPSSLRLGVSVSLATLLAAPAAVLALWYRDRRPRPAGGRVRRTGQRSRHPPTSEA
jgi:hypothetical protein